MTKPSDEAMRKAKELLETLSEIGRTDASCSVALNIGEAWNAYQRCGQEVIAALVDSERAAVRREALNDAISYIGGYASVVEDENCFKVLRAVEQSIREMRDQKGGA